MKLALSIIDHFSFYIGLHDVWKKLVLLLSCFVYLFEENLFNGLLNGAMNIYLLHKKNHNPFLSGLTEFHHPKLGKENPYPLSMGRQRSETVQLKRSVIEVDVFKF